jgi:hypothetical protein
MKKIAFVAAALVLMATTVTHAAEYQVFDGGSRNWRSGFLRYLAKYRPTPDGISVGMMNNRIYAYLVPGGFAGTYAIQRIRHHPYAPNGVVKALVDGGNGRILGFINGYCIVLTWTRQ